MAASRSMTIEQEYVAQRPRSQEMSQRARQAFPRGVTHDVRYTTPFPPYVVRAQGTRKWDIDGLEYIDYVTGHGSLMLGHGHPSVVEAVSAQMAKGTHFGACHELEVQWAELIKQLMPSIEEVEFTNSGTEATMMAMRLARAFTGKPRIVKFDFHFHGWHDYAVVGMAMPLDVPASIGVPKEIIDTVSSVPCYDIEAVRQELDGGDVAAVILEANGAYMGRVPTTPEFLRQLRELTASKGVVLIFDEVVSGFRVAPGGTQSLYGIRPDLTTLAKILVGGLPGGAVGGKQEIMEALQFKPDRESNRFKRVPHPGTFNANPLCAAAGVACLSLIAEGKVHEQANRMTERLASGMRQVLVDRSVPGMIGGERSLLHVWLGEGVNAGNVMTAKVFPTGVIERAMLVHGVHIMGGHTILLSGKHDEDDIDKTVAAFDASILRLQEEGAL